MTAPRCKYLRCCSAPPPPQAVLVLSLRYYNKGKSYPIKITTTVWILKVLLGRTTRKAPRTHLFFTMVLWTSSLVRGRVATGTGRMERESISIFLPLKYVILKSIFTLLQFAKRLHSFFPKIFFKNFRNILVEFMCLELKIQEMHITTSLLNRGDNWGGAVSTSGFHPPPLLSGRSPFRLT